MNPVSSLRFQGALAEALKLDCPPRAEAKTREIACNAPVDLKQQTNAPLHLKSLLLGLKQAFLQGLKHLGIIRPVTRMDAKFELMDLFSQFHNHPPIHTGFTVWLGPNIDLNRRHGRYVDVFIDERKFVLKDFQRLLHNMSRHAHLKKPMNFDPENNTFVYKGHRFQVGFFQGGNASAAELHQFLRTLEEEHLRAGNEPDLLAKTQPDLNVSASKL